MGRLFKIRDLVINVLPEDEEAAAAVPLAGCPVITCFTCTQTFTCVGATCSPFSSCGGASVACGACSLNITTHTQQCCNSCHPAITNTQPLGSLGRDDLAVLKAELARELQAIENREAELDEVMRPKSTDEIDALTERLEAALAELREERGHLAED